MNRVPVGFTTIMLIVFFTGCSLVNAVRHVTPPIGNRETSKPENGKPLQKSNTESLIAKAKEIADTSFPLKLNPKAKVTGKTLVIEKTEVGSVGVKGFNYNGDDYYQLDLDKYGLKTEALAVKPDEIQTVILKSCTKGKQIGQYKLLDGRKIPAFARDCKVSVIDYQTSAVVAERKFSGNQMAETIVKESAVKEVVSPEPWIEIDKYIRNFPRQ